MIGTHIANYRIEGVLGKGGMGIVYKAFDITLDRPVAIKVLMPDLARDPVLVERFRAEAKAQAKLSHANVATLHNFLNADGHCLIVMEYLDGETVHDLIRRRGLIPYGEAVPLFRQALLGVGFAHRMGIIHRDIKPSNIMVNRHGPVKVMDFGIAKVLGGGHLTRTGVQIGTVAYMSPEQVRNEVVDHRSDVYALGVTLYEMLTAHVPFENESDFQVMWDHVNTPPPRPSRYCPNIPRGIEDAIFKALEKRPEARFQSVDEFSGALECRHGLKVPEARFAVVAALRDKGVPLKPATPGAQSPVQPSPRARALEKMAPGNVTPATHNLSSQAPGTAFQTRLNRFSALVIGVIALFSLLAGALYRESIPMLVVFAVLVYFFPVLLAAVLRKRNGFLIVKLNALRGWTGLGWLQAMKQALLDDE